MKCSNCKNKEAHIIRMSFDEKGKLFENCNKCGAVSTTWTPDVYWPGHAHENSNLCGADGKPVYLTSRRHKAEVMRELGVSEAGDRVKGARVGTYDYFIKKPVDNTKQIIRETLNQFRRKYAR